MHGPSIWVSTLLSIKLLSGFRVVINGIFFCFSLVTIRLVHLPEQTKLPEQIEFDLITESDETVRMCIATIAGYRALIETGLPANIDGPCSHHAADEFSSSLVLQYCFLKLQLEQI